MTALRILLLALAAIAPAAHAETWQCTDAKTGRSYTVSQAVPVDQCTLISRTSTPHSNGPAASEQPLPASMRRRTSCDRFAAQDVEFNMRDLAGWHIEGDHLTVHWTFAIEKQPETKRLQLITTYTDMDACLGGAAREIMFYRKGKLMGIASPTMGIRTIN